MVKPVGAFEWGAVLSGTAVVTTIVVAYAVGWERAAGESRDPIRGEVKPATSVVRAPPRKVAPRVRAPARQRPAYVLTARRGDAWLLVREGSFRGRTLFEGLLPIGESLRLRAPRLWVRFGAAANVELRAGGRTLRLPSNGTFDAYVGPGGARADRTDYATAAQSP